jgi:hypothetical protein
MRTRMNGEVRDRLRQLLLQRARVLGLTPGAVEQLLQAPVLERWSADDEIRMGDDEGERVGLVVVGAAKVVCETPRGKGVTVCFVPPGQFLAPEWPGDGASPRRALRVVAHDPLGTIVATWASRILMGVVATLPPAYAMQLVTTTWRGTFDVLLQKSQLLGLALHDRVLAVLITLARDFGRPHPDGIRIELKLTHLDLAGVAVGSRANVTRALEQLRSAGLVSVEQHRLLVTQRGLTALRADAGMAGAWTPPEPRPRVDDLHGRPTAGMIDAWQ